MGMMIPGELAALLNMLGYSWPEGDEEKLFELGGDWLDFAGVVQQHGQQADAVAAQVPAVNRGAAVEALRANRSGEEGPGTVSGGNSTAVTVLGAGFMVVAGIVLALKVAVIVQLTILAVQIAQAIATAAPTLGASLLEIPIFKMITGLIIDQLIGLALQAVLGG